MLGDSLEGWDGEGGREAQDGRHICRPTAYSCGWGQKPAQHCNSIILQLNINFKN